MYKKKNFHENITIYSVIGWKIFKIMWKHWMEILIFIKADRYKVLMTISLTKKSNFDSKNWFAGFESFTSVG